MEKGATMQSENPEGAEEEVSSSRKGKNTKKEHVKAKDKRTLHRECKEVRAREK